MDNLRIEGMDVVAARLAELGNKANRVVNKAIRDAGEIVADAMRSNVAVSSVEHRHIQDDIEVSRVKGAGDKKYVEVGPGRETNWRAKFLEFGTTKMPAQPFVERSLTENRQDVMESLSKSVREGLGL